MGSHGKKVEIDLSKPYEKNEIQLRGIILTTIALFITCVVSFYLMWVLQSYMEANWAEADKQNETPMGLNKPEEKLPPEPRLQSAPGFGVDSPEGRVNLELKNPQAEWHEVQKIWAKEAEEGQKIAKDGQTTVITLPIAEAKKKVLEDASIKSASAEDSQKNLTETNNFYSSASAGRKATEKRR
jgi:hypothetical protein